MKKYTLLPIGIFIASLLFSGCGTPEAQIPTNEGKSVTYIGTLKSLGEVMVEEKADHILSTDDGNVYYVYSQFVDLDKEKYKNAKLQVSGKVVKLTESGKEIVAIESIVPLTDESIENDIQVEVVKKYQNLDLGFKLDGLKAFEVKEFIDHVVFTKEGATFQITRFDNKNSFTLDEWLDVSSKDQYRSPVFLGLDKLKAYVLEGDGETKYFLSRTNQYMYEIDLSFSNDAMKNELKTVLNSFRFVPVRDPYADNMLPTPNGNHAAIEIEAVKTYFSSHIADLVPDYGGTNYVISKFEFLNTPSEGLPMDEPNYVYVVYDANGVLGRILTSYHFSMNKVTDVKVEAIFKAGTVTDWELVDGEDKIKGQPTLVITEAGDGSATPIALQVGYRLFESVPFHFSIQYPSDWYVQGQSGKYLFNDQPLNGKYLISVEVQKKDIQDVLSNLPFTFEKTDIRHDREIFISHQTNSDTPGVYMVMPNTDATQTYVFWSSDSTEDILKKMIASIVES